MIPMTIRSNLIEFVNRCLNINLLISLFLCYYDGYSIRGYIDSENCRQFRLLIWTSFIGKFIHPVEGKGMVLRVWIGDIVIFSSCEDHFY